MSKTVESSDLIFYYIWVLTIKHEMKYSKHVGTGQNNDIRLQSFAKFVSFKHNFVRSFNIFKSINI